MMGWLHHIVYDPCLCFYQIVPGTGKDSETSGRLCSPETNPPGDAFERTVCDRKLQPFN